MKGTRTAAGDQDLRKKLIVVGVAFLFLITIFTVIFGKKGVMEIHRARKQLAVLQTELAGLEAQRDKLEKEIIRLEKDPRSVERTAREKLGLAAPGEKVIITSGRSAR